MPFIFFRRIQYKNMKKILIGSRALYWYTDIKIRLNTDWDIISKNPIQDTKEYSVDHHSYSTLNNEKLIEYINPHAYTTINEYKIHLLSKRGLALVKRSHLWRPEKFFRNMYHYYKGGLVMEKDLFTKDDLGFLAERIKLTKQMVKSINPNLNKTPKEFFSDNITRTWNHDTLHEIIAYGKEPIYRKILVSSDKVQCSKDKWEELSPEEKLKCVLEEAYVIALERFILVDPKYSIKLAFLKALEKICTTMCSGFFRDYAIDNFDILTTKSKDLIDLCKSERLTSYIGKEIYRRR